VFVYPSIRAFSLPLRFTGEKKEKEKEKEKGEPQIGLPKQREKIKERIDYHFFWRGEREDIDRTIQPSLLS
jgi:hypothetical protein